MTSRLTAAKAWLERHLLIPDEAITGVPGMILRGVRLHRQRPFDAIVVSVPAYSPWLAGIAIKRICNLPLVVDYRDLWHGDVLRQWIGPWRSRAERTIERWALSNTDAVATVTTRYSQRVRDLDPAPDARPYETIYSGFDMRLFPKNEPNKRSNPTTVEILCVGKLYKTRRADGLVGALGRLQAARRLGSTPWRLTFLGHVAEDQRKRLDAIINRFALEHHICFEGFVSRDEALRRERQADALALIVDTGPTSDGVVPGKVFEYLALGRRILAICPPGETEQLVQKAGFSLIARPDDPEGIERILCTLFSQAKAGSEVGVLPGSNRLPFVADRQAALLAGLLNRVVAGRGRQDRAADHERTSSRSERMDADGQFPSRAISESW